MVVVIAPPDVLREREVQSLDMLAVRGARAHRIGEVADRVGVTTRTIRYYEERGLLGNGTQRAKGTHRLYGEADIVRLQELIRLRDLLGLSLEELVELAEAEEARAVLRGRWTDTADDEERGRIVESAIPLVERQLELVTARQETLAEFAAELKDKLAQLKRRRVPSSGRPGDVRPPPYHSE